MLTRDRDVMYCGVREEVIKNAMPKLNETNFRHLFNFITERYTVRKKKDVYREPAPWTTDPVLLNYRFTNVRREHDRESLWLIQNILERPDISYENKIMNCILFRMFNKSETSRLYGYWIDFTSPIDFEGIRERLHNADANGQVLFTSAFMTVGIKVPLGKFEPTADDFIPMRVIKYADWLYKDGIVDRIKAALDQEEVFHALEKCLGFGEFLSYQMFVDFTYIDEFPFSENEFTVVGPGCLKGLKYLFEDTDDMTWDECLFWLRDNIDIEFTYRNFPWYPEQLFDDLPEHDRHMNVMSLENCFCELSKYIRAVEGTGRPRNKYKAHPTPLFQ